jgi:hypothetical protein
MDNNTAIALMFSAFMISNAVIMIVWIRYRGRD